MYNTIYYVGIHYTDMCDILHFSEVYEPYINYDSTLIY